jgi:hypothetical protein
MMCAQRQGLLYPDGGNERVIVERRLGAGPKAWLLYGSTDANKLEQSMVRTCRRRNRVDQERRLQVDKGGKG